MVWQGRLQTVSLLPWVDSESAFSYIDLFSIFKIFFFFNLRWLSAIWRCSSICSVVASSHSEYSDIKSTVRLALSFLQVAHRASTTSSCTTATTCNKSSLFPDLARGRTREGKVQELWIKQSDGPTTALLGLESFFLLMLARDYDDPVKSLFSCSLIQKDRYSLCWLSR